MKKVNAFRCEHCGKVYLREHACIVHEEKRCCKNPLNIPYCYSCRHYEASTDKESVVYWIDDNWLGSQEEYTKNFELNRCTHPQKNCKLFNNINLSDEMYEGLREADFEPMPTNKTGGCDYYEPYTGHPHVEILAMGKKFF